MATQEEINELMGKTTAGLSQGPNITLTTPEVKKAKTPLTFEQLRQRLPQEIPDDVIRLLASSDEALLEFSNIATQQDVDEFNVKYGVELVLPQV